MARRWFIISVASVSMWTMAGARSAAAAALSVTEVHGHVLGEKLQDYIAQDNQLQKELKACAQVVRKKRPQVTDHDYAFDQSKVEKAHRWDYCESLLSGVNKGSRVILHTSGYIGAFGSGTTLNPDDDVLVYDQGVLVSINTYTGVMRSGAKLPPRWEDVVAELTKRMGKPTQTLDRITENAYGATFHHRAAIWDKPEFYAEVYEKDGSVGDPENNILIETPEEHRRKQAEQSQSKASALQ